MRITPALLEGFSSAGGDPIRSMRRHPSERPGDSSEAADVGPDAVNDTFLGYSVTLNSTIPGCHNKRLAAEFLRHLGGGTDVAGRRPDDAGQPGGQPAQINAALEDSASRWGPRSTTTAAMASSSGRRAGPAATGATCTVAEYGYGDDRYGSDP